MMVSSSSSYLKSLLPLLLLILLPPVSAFVRDVESTCEAALLGNKQLVKLCVDSLKMESIPPGSRADKYALGAAHQSLLKVQIAWNKATSLKGHCPQEPLDKCLRLYLGLQDMVQDAVNLLQTDHSLPALRKAYSDLSGAGGLSFDCTRAFWNFHMYNPMSQESEDVSNILWVSDRLAFYCLPH